MSSPAQHLKAISAATERLALSLGLSAEQIESRAGYEQAEEHLFDSLTRLSLNLKRYILTYWYRMADRSGRLNDVLVSVDEMMRFFGVGQSHAPELEANLATIDAELALWDDRMKARLAATPSHVQLPIIELKRAFDLDDVAVEVLIAAAAPALDVGFERLYRFAWADFAQRHPSISFIVELLGTTPETRRGIRSALVPSHPLRRYQLLSLDAAGGEGVEPSRAHGSVCVPNRVLSILHGIRELDDEHLTFMKLYRTGPRVEELVIEEKVKDAMRVALQTASEGRAKLVVTGAEGVGKVALARALAMERRRPLLKVDLLQLAEDGVEARYQLGCAVRESIISHADVVLDDSGQFRDERDVGDLLEPILWAFETCPNPIYFVTDGSPMWLHGRRDDLVEIGLMLSPPKGQAELWRRAFEVTKLAPHVNLAEIVQRYSLSAGSIHRAASEAIRLSEIRHNGQDVEVRLDDMTTAIRHQFHHRLGALAQPISTTLVWNDVVLPDHLIVRIKEIIAYARHRDHVYDKWGFRRKMSYGRGLTCMFSGPPGTGKTMMVCIIARELGRELFRVDVARVVDKYIGETEKNLARVFEEAERSQAIILFDEADSLFAKRTEVKSSHDRYANLEVNYLLQRMEQFDGATFLTTNFETAIDEAFERRLKFKLQFPMPDAKERERLWRAMFPPEAALGDDVDWRQLAEDFDMSGGLIKNAVLRGAFLAAEEKVMIGHEVLYRAAMTELKDAGHVIRDDKHRLW
ncbi:MAG: hypothetical protein AUK47_11320 [Deltaproteobacteria bacterium CG2_30_63_29]|nr:MAG: hypothetical protein AUK47_11320 [Deltaproteobacteria bacterium CG2_30_63_29]PJB36400.1 MAG: hypothetical protein CO108_23510 [Deltaproteobacteria bacterium CG_4_9_14_3_um_filter_63_12]